MFVFASCQWPTGHGGEGVPSNHAKKYSADVAIAWINLQQDLLKTTPGFDPLVAARSFSYSGLTLYESIVMGMPGYNSVAAPRMGVNVNSFHKHPIVYWPASANAAMASILKNLFRNTSAANVARIDSMESAFSAQFQHEATAKVLGQSAEYGKAIATKIFEWSKTDGGHEAYLSATNSDYTPPTGPGLWIPTPPNHGQPIRPYWGNNRSFVPNSAVLTMSPLPYQYSEDPASDFYKDAIEVYNVSLSLTPEDISIVKTWGDIAGNYGTSGHYTNIATQLIQENEFKLDAAAVTYAKHGIAIYEATISVFKSKYTYNLIRPVSFVRNVLGHSAWSSIIGTPPHPEYPSAHATIGGASYTVLENIFGKNYSFIDRTHENIFGARSYESLKAYAVEAADSRLIGGLHYRHSAEVGLIQGEKVGKLVNDIRFRGQAK